MCPIRIEVVLFASMTSRCYKERKMRENSEEKSYRFIEVEM